MIKFDFETRLRERELRGADFTPVNEHRSNIPFVQDWPKADLIETSLEAPVFPSMLNHNQSVERPAFEAPRDAALLQLLCATSDGIWDFNLQTRTYTFWSDRLTGMLGYAPGELAPSVENFTALLHPDDAAKTEALERHYTRETPFYQAEFRLRHKDGSYRWIISRGMAAFDENGKPVRMLGAHTDITEQREAELRAEASAERFRRLVEIGEALSGSMTEEQAAQVILRRGIDATNAFAGCMARASEDGCTLELISAQGMPEQAIQQWHTFSTDLPTPMSQAARGKKPVFLSSASERLALYRLASLEAPLGGAVLSAASVPLIADDRLLGVLGLMFDHERLFGEEDREFIAALSRQCAQALERARLFSAERQARAKAEEANRAKDNFLAILSHELRTPLTPVLTSAQMLEREAGLTEDQRDLVSIVRRNVELEARLIDDLFDFTRISRGKLELAISPVNVSRAVEQAIAICESEIEAKYLHVSTGLAERCCVTLGDPARLQQVVWNLLQNAIKFTGPGGAIDIETRCDQKTITLTIRDTGCGIEPALLPDLFNALERSEEHITQRFGGLGLGLTIAKNLVEKHGGTIQIESEGRDRGTLIRLTLPCRAAEAAEHYRSSFAFAEVAPVHARILLVEDNPDTLQLMRRLLESGGYTVQTADGLTSARRAAESAEFDILVSDIGLPDGSGLDLMRELAAKTQIRGIAVSGYGMEHDIERSKEAGFSAHVIKPIDIDTLENEIKKLLN